ncbi:hypothetical protein BJ878DRAFT_284863 [Calycina marina]|uniref:Uncharacterized protein n=1 Tax=Calycina marina TaxID=1763456 RepID=A0A9P7Z6B2_9HELO|nr:hypothetical protein BJ878DRAFT_284863 [Calycina marina]
MHAPHSHQVNDNRINLAPPGNDKNSATVVVIYARKPPVPPAESKSNDCPSLQTIAAPHYWLSWPYARLNINTIGTSSSNSGSKAKVNESARNEKDNELMAKTIPMRSIAKGYQFPDNTVAVQQTIILISIRSSRRSSRSSAKSVLSSPSPSRSRRRSLSSADFQASRSQARGLSPINLQFSRSRARSQSPAKAQNSHSRAARDSLSINSRFSGSRSRSMVRSASSINLHTPPFKISPASVEPSGSRTSSISPRSQKYARFNARHPSPGNLQGSTPRTINSASGIARNMN